MPLASTAAENADLDANYGDGHAAGWPDTFTLHLFDGDPRDDGEELDADGYAPVDVDNDTATFPDATSGVKRSVLIAFDEAGEDWPTVEWWLLKSGDDATWLETCALAEPTDVPEGSTLKIRLAITHDLEAI